MSAVAPREACIRGLELRSIHQARTVREIVYIDQHIDQYRTTVRHVPHNYISPRPLPQRSPVDYEAPGGAGIDCYRHSDQSTTKCGRTSYLVRLTFYKERATIRNINIIIIMLHACRTSPSVSRQTHPLPQQSRLLSAMVLRDRCCYQSSLFVDIFFLYYYNQV